MRMVHEPIDVYKGAKYHKLSFYQRLSHKLYETGEKQEQSSCQRYEFLKIKLG